VRGTRGEGRGFRGEGTDCEMHTGLQGRHAWPSGYRHLFIDEKKQETRDYVAETKALQTTVL
jgi:hypothetical protein